jgi:hypothetical protein
LEWLEAAPDANPHAPLGVVIYDNRNRVYSPDLRRFVQRDPNQSGVPAVRLAMSGSAAGLSAAAFNLEGSLGDGCNPADSRGGDDATGGRVFPRYPNPTAVSRGRANAASLAARRGCRQVEQQHQPAGG